MGLLCLLASLPPTHALRSSLPRHQLSWACHSCPPSPFGGPFPNLGLPQVEQEASFKSGLKAINQWYAHQGTTVWLVTAGALAGFEPCY